MKTTIFFLSAMLLGLLLSCGETPETRTYKVSSFYSNGTKITDSLHRYRLEREAIAILSSKNVKDENIRVYTSLRADMNDVIRPQLSLMSDEVYANINWKNTQKPDLREEAERLRKEGKFFDAALVAIDNKTGQVVAYFSTYGGPNSDGVSTLAPIGSLQQTFSFAQGLEREYTPFDIYPRFDRSLNRIDPDFKRPFYQALEMASPTYAQGLDRRYTIAQSADFLRRLDVQHGELNDPIFRFKTTMSLLDVTKTYATFYNKGRLLKPSFIDSITDHKGKLLYKHMAKPRTVIDAQTAEEVMQILAFHYLHEPQAQLYNERNVPEFIGQFKALEARFNGSGWFIAVTDDYTIGVRNFTARKDISYPKKDRHIQLRDRTFPLWYKTIERLRNGKTDVPSLRKIDLSGMTSYR